MDQQDEEIEGGIQIHYEDSAGKMEEWWWVGGCIKYVHCCQSYVT